MGIFDNSGHTSSRTTLPPGFRILVTSLRSEAFPSGGNKLTTQLERIQSTEFDSTGRRSVRRAFTKATCGGLSPFAAAFDRARAIMSYNITIKKNMEIDNKRKSNVHQTYPILSLNQLVPPSRRQGRHRCHLRIQDQPLFLPIRSYSCV